MTEIRYFDAGQEIVRDMLERKEFEEADAICIVVLKDGECWVGRSWHDERSPFEMPGALMHAAQRWLERFVGGE